MVQDGNLFAALPSAVAAEVVTLLAQASSVRIERIVSEGQATADGTVYDQEENEWVVLLQGSAALRFEDETFDRTLRPGDFLFIAAHRRHRVQWTSASEPTVWLAVWFP